MCGGRYKQVIFECTLREVFQQILSTKKIIGTIKAPPALSQGALSASDALNIYLMVSPAVQWL